MYADTSLFIDGDWAPAESGGTLDVRNPATGAVIGAVAHARRADLQRALSAAQAGYSRWRRVSAHDRARVLRAAGQLLRDRSTSAAAVLTMEQGKPVADAKFEINLTAELLDWFAEEATRTYGRVIPARSEGVYQLVVKEPVGPVAAFTPWNYPISQAARKVAAALAAGCSIVIKGPEETPASCAALVQALQDAGLPPGVVNLIFGTPAEISEFLIPHPVIRKVSFTGSTQVGKHLAALAGQHMKRTTMELGGHSPAIVFEDADVEAAARMLVANKYRNAGQICISPTRMLVHDSVYDRFLDRFVEVARAIKVGNGMDPASKMGPLANVRRLRAMEAMVGDAVERGARVRCGGDRIGSTGYFFQPTVLTEVPLDSRLMNEEPFGPVALVSRFSEFDDAVKEANRLPYGLAAYAYTRSARTAQAIAAAVESGQVAINHHVLALPELPAGGIKDSGHGLEGGSEAIEAYLSVKFVTQAGM